jgi:hypothetical protein
MVRLTDGPTSTMLVIDNQTRRDGRRSEHRPSFRTESTRSRDCRPGQPIARRRIITRHRAPRDRTPARPITPRSAARKNHRSHAHAIPSHVLGWTFRLHASPPSPGHRQHRWTPLLQHQWLRQLPGRRPRRPRGDLPGLRLPPPARLGPSAFARAAPAGPGGATAAPCHLTSGMIEPSSPPPR